MFECAEEPLPCKVYNFFTHYELEKEGMKNTGNQKKKE